MQVKSAFYLVQTSAFTTRKDGEPVTPGTMYLNSLGGNALPENARILNSVIAESQGIEVGKCYLLQVEDTGTNNEKGYAVVRHLKVGGEVSVIDSLRIKKEFAEEFKNFVPTRGQGESAWTTANKPVEADNTKF